MKTALLIAMTFAITTSALAESPYCIPKADGTNRFQKTGSSCPTGYFASGRCCEALHKDSPYAMPKIRGAACPAGFFESGGSCEKLR